MWNREGRVINVPSVRDLKVNGHAEDKSSVVELSQMYLCEKIHKRSFPLQSSNLNQDVLRQYSGNTNDRKWKLCCHPHQLNSFRFYLSHSCSQPILFQ